jgi:hypothetical protein
MKRALTHLGYAAIERPNGQLLRVTHRKEGIGAAGDLETPAIIMATTTTIQPYAVAHEVRLLGA